MRSRCCQACSTWYPLADDYKRCPTCNGLTVPSIHAASISKTNAEKLLASWRFERFYQRREQRKKREGLMSPEEVAHMEVAELKALELRAAA